MGDFDWRGHRYTGKHEPLVSRDMWKRVQALLDTRRVAKDRPATRRFAYSGLISCGHCGCAMVGEIKKGRYIYYHCTGFKGKCGERYVREEALQEKLMATVGQLHFSGEVLSDITGALSASHQTQQQVHNDAIARLRAECERLQGRLHTMYVDKLDGRIDESLYGRLSSDWGEQLRECPKEIEQHRAADRSYLEDGVLLLEVARNAQAAFADNGSDTRSRILKLAVSNCSWKGGEVQVEFRQPFDLIAKAVHSDTTSANSASADLAERPEWWRTQS